MNEKAQSLKMNKSRYTNSHGLSNPISRSSAYDTAILCEYSMKNEKFCEIVSCKRYECKIM